MRPQSTLTRHCPTIAFLLAALPTHAGAAYDCTTLKATACLLGDGDAIPAATVAVQLPKGLCSGTVLATVDGTTASQLVLTAAHCLALPSEPPPSATVSVSVYYRALGSCVVGNSGMQSVAEVARSTLSATADVLVYDPPRSVAQPDGSTKAVGTDATIIRINSPAPRGVYFASWNASVLATGGESLTVGHGSGYQSTYARGTTEVADTNDDKFGSFSTDGNTVGGHSGSGIYSTTTGELIGQASGASCTENAPAGSGLREGNQSSYGRFSSVYLLAKQYLDPANSGAMSAVGYFAATPPEVTFTVGGGPSASAPVGSVATLSWAASSDATSCLASGSWTGSKPISGATSIRVEAGTHNYTLSCTNPGGATTKSVAVTGTSPPSTGSSGGDGAGSGGGSMSLFVLIPMLAMSRWRAWTTRHRRRLSH